MDGHQISTEIVTKELPFEEKSKGPVEENIRPLKDSQDTDVKDAIEGMVLHQAAMSGKLDRVREILEAGGQGTGWKEDDGGRNAQQIAKEMVANHTADKERVAILQMVQSRHDSSRPENNESTKTVATSANDLESLLSAELASIKDSMETQISGIRDVLKTELSAVKKSLSEITGKQENTFSVVDNLKLSESDLRLRMKSVHSLVPMQKQFFDEMKEHQDKTKTEQSRLSAAVASLKESMEMQKKEEVDELKMSNKIQLQIQEVTEEVHNAKNKILWVLHNSSKEFRREECMEAMMGKTEVVPSNKENISKIRSRYEMLYDEDPIISSILEFLQHEPGVKVLVDLKSQNVGKMRPRVKWNRREVSGLSFTYWIDSEERNAYVGGRHSTERSAIQFMAEAFSQLSVHLAFNNQGLPYSAEGGDGERFKGILAETMRKAIAREKMDYSITLALGQPTQLIKQMQLISTVPRVIAGNGSLDGRSKLRQVVPSLLEYYDGHVVATLKDETKKKIATALGQLESVGQDEKSTGAVVV